MAITWTERTPAGSRNWQGVASSSDGSKLIVSAYGGYLYTGTSALIAPTNLTLACGV